MIRTFISIIIVGTLLLLTPACSSSKKSSGSSKTINGNWQLRAIVSEGVTGKINTTLFDEAGFNCFIGSTWHFTTHNNTGYYSISKNGNECDAAKRAISWNVDEQADQPKQFYFKKQGAADEYRFSIIKLVSDSMQLQSAVIIDGKTASLLYKFIRI
jgi:hypothetical protein